MAIVHFCKGVVLEIDGREYSMKREVAEGLWQLEDRKTGRIQEFTLEALQQRYVEGSLTFPEDAEKVALRNSAEAEKSRTHQRKLVGVEWNNAKARRTYVLAVEHLPCTQSLMEPAIEKVWQETKITEKAPHWTTVARWKKQYLANGKDAFALAAQHHAKGRHEARYPGALIEILENCIDKIYMQRERKTMQETLEEAIVQVTRENDQRPVSLHLPLPTRRLLRRLIEAISAFDKHAARYGRVAANRTFRTKLKHLVTNKPLEAAEIDHTKLDLFVIDDESHMPLGRPWLTICIDRHTRCILGIYIGFEPPSYLTVGKCLKHAFLPKTDLKKQYPDIRHDWAAHGVMELLYVDNGLEFHSISLEQACYAFGVEIVFTPRKTPWYKGEIERFNGTLNRSLSHGIAGTTFSNIFDKDDYDPAKHAVVTLSTLRLIVYKWIADYYHQKPHRSLDNQTPAVMWSSSIRAEDIHLAHDPAQIDVLLGKAVADKLVSHKGIEINNLLYNSIDLMQLRRQRGDTFKVDIRVDESDLGHIFVILDGGQDYLEVPALNQEYAKDMTLWLHNLCRKYAKEHFSKTDIYSYARAKTEIREIVERGLNIKSKKSHSKVGRYLDTNKQAISKKTAIQPPLLADNSTAFFLEQQANPLAKPRAKYAPIMQNRS